MTDWLVISVAKEKENFVNSLLARLSPGHLGKKKAGGLKRLLFWERGLQCRVIPVLSRSAAVHLAEQNPGLAVKALHLLSLDRIEVVS